MSRTLQLDVAAVAPDGKRHPPTPAEQLDCALALLQRALDSGARPSVPMPERATPGEAFAVGAKLLLYAFPRLDKEQRITLARHLTSIMKRALPVEVRWTIFSDDSEPIGDVQEFMSQHEAQQRFGMGR